MNNQALLTCLLAGVLSIGHAFGQNLWVEDFSGAADGTTSDAGTTAWSRDISGASMSGHFEVRNNQLEVNDTDGEVVWSSEWIDIASYSAVKISFTLSSDGHLNASAPNQDWFRD